MLRFTMFLWKRVEQDKNGNLWSKTDTAKEVVSSKKYKDMYQAFNSSRLNPEKEAKNLFKLVTDPRQKPYFKSRYFVGIQHQNYLRFFQFQDQDFIVCKTN